MLERKSGVALWRQIADLIRSDIASGVAGQDGRLPPEMQLAKRYGVNRHTVRAAIGALEQEGVLRSEQGRGTFVRRRKRLTYPIRKRTRFSAGLGSQAASTRTRLLESGPEAAPEPVAEALGLAAGSQVIRLETVSEADGVPVSRATSWFDAQRFAGIDRAFEEHASITRALASCGVEDYVRASTIIEARHASAEDIELLRLSAGAIVLVTRAVNTAAEGRPIQYSETRFAADRVELRIENEDA
ncbi:phosphonate metabolism transcriptional regulator PhnF [Oricola sp.]|uniref:phosphonate metabolism transcriptional regulator PhnF n=1 Tax=Oricola sp. TaxID=1979950 RepID=UPI0025D86034|nr:phosphonate metabolism transcriptional regulator PhnF [Oricola sp.]MCI5078351.1 phosphonate metabolism transcriptional regulator PhnF [Oricola sp.]